MSEGLRIAFDIAALGQGGMERQLVDLAAGLVRRGHHPMIVVNKRASAYLDEIEAAAIPLVELHRMRRFDWSVVDDVAATIRDHASQVIVGVNFNATAIARLAARRVGVPAVTAEHSTDRGRPLSVVISNRLLASSASAVIACAEAQVPSLVAEGNPRDRIRVVRNGVDVAGFRPQERARGDLRSEWRIPQDAFVVGMIAAHRREKRHDRFVDVIGILAERGADAYGVAVGGGPMLKHSEEIAAASGSPDRIRITGPRTDLPSVYSACDVCILCSDAVETLPLVLMEAQACGTPVVAMDVGGVSETFEDGRTGILVGPGDVEAMADALEALSKDLGTARTMGASGRTWVAEHRSLDAMVDGYLDVLQTAIAQKGSGR